MGKAQLTLATALAFLLVAAPSAFATREGTPFSAGAVTARFAAAEAGAELVRPRRMACGQVGSSAGAGYGEIRAFGLSCAVARRVIQSWGTGKPGGWVLIHHRGKDEFRKGRKRITGVPLGD